MHVLVTFASRHGSTRGIAEAIASELEAQGHTSTFLEASQVRQIDRYDAVVVGSGIYVGKWLKGAQDFIVHWQEALKGVPVWMFSSGPVGDQIPTDPPGLSGLTATLDLQGHIVFGGRLDVSELGIGERLITKVVRAPQGDFRDWEAIAAWARSIASSLDTIAESTVGGTTQPETRL